MIGSHFTVSAGAFAFSALVTFCYALLFLLPGLLFTRLAQWLSFRLAACLGVLYASLLLFVFYIDARLFAMYGFHFNGFVWNLLTTPGGFASLGSSSSSNLCISLQAGAVVVAEALWLGLCRFAATKQLTLPTSFFKYTLFAWLPLLVVCQLSFGFSRIYTWHPVTATAKQIPFFSAPASMAWPTPLASRSYVKKATPPKDASTIRVRPLPQAPILGRPTSSGWSPSHCAPTC